MIQIFLKPELQRRKIESPNNLVQQDDAMNRHSMEVIYDVFLSAMTYSGLHVRLIYRSMTTYLWGYLKSNIFINKPRTHELKLAVRQEIPNIPTEILQTAIKRFRKRLQDRIEKDEKDLNVIIFRY